MSLALIIQPLAEDDITEAAQWYEGQQAGLGAEFLSEIQVALERAVAAPRQFACLRRKPDVRRVLTNRFRTACFSCWSQVRWWFFACCTEHGMIGNGKAGFPESAGMAWGDRHSVGKL